MNRFRKFLSFLCLAVLLTAGASRSAVPAEAAQTKKTLKVLAIGNSFSTDATEHMYKIAADLGFTEIVIGNLYIGGCSLATHWTNARTNSASYTYFKNNSGKWVQADKKTMLHGIQDENWDYITLQQVSQDTGVPSTYNSDLTNLIDYVNSKKTNSKAQLLWHMTWAYQSNSTHSGFAQYGRNQMSMYQAIVSAVQQKILTNSNFAFVIPSGTAIQNMRTSFVGDTLTRDGYHLTYDLGRYIAALTWVVQIGGISLDNVVSPPGYPNIPLEYWPAIKEAVRNAVATPYAVTQSSYKTKPVFDYSGYELLDWKPVGGAFWNSNNKTYPTQLISNASNSKYFVSSGKMFTREEIPVGSIIVVESGYQYRPEGWVTLGVQSGTRPGNVTTERVLVNEEWWGNYKYRAFNVSDIRGNVDLTGKVSEVASKFRIYVPAPDSGKSSQKLITEFKINNVSGVISGNQITVTLPAKTDVTKLTPQIKISAKAKISPASGTVRDFSKPVTYIVTAEDGSIKSYVVTVKLSGSAGAPASSSKPAGTVSDPSGGSNPNPASDPGSPASDSSGAPADLSSDETTPDEPNFDEPAGGTESEPAESQTSDEPGKETAGDKTDRKSPVLPIVLAVLAVGAAAAVTAVVLKRRKSAE